MASATVATHKAVRLSRFPNLRGLSALLVLSLRQQIRGWRLVILGLLFLLPGGLAAVVCLTVPVLDHRSIPAEVLEFGFLFMLIPHALAPLAALLCSAGIIRDEVEEQTLTYLLLRPLARTAIYAVKLLSSLVTTALLTSLFTVATLLLIASLTDAPLTAELFVKGMKIAAIFSLAQVAYCGLFALMALLMRRALLIGVVYIIFFEGLLASFDTIARRLTVMYYFRVLVLRWLEPTRGKVEWTLDLKTAPSSVACMLILLGAGLTMAIVGSLIFAVREFRMKTPEGE
ncbi:MAG: ABC transporter permease subunit [Thermoguttaceae bacterium]|jgi:ABC-2 type transport system permease protein